jgi:hypothetical protein
MCLLVNDTAGCRWRKRGIPKCRISVGVSSAERETIRPRTHTQSVSRQNSSTTMHFANGQFTVRRYYHTLWDFAKEAPRAGLVSVRIQVHPTSYVHHKSVNSTSYNHLCEKSFSESIILTGAFLGSFLPVQE